MAHSKKTQSETWKNLNRKVIFHVDPWAIDVTFEDHHDAVGGSHIVTAPTKIMADMDNTLRAMPKEQISLIISNELQPASITTVVSRYLHMAKDYNCVTLYKYIKSLPNVAKVAGRGLFLNDKLITDLRTMLVGVSATNILDFGGDDDSATSIKKIFPKSNLLQGKPSEKFTAKKYDLVIVNHTLHHMADPISTLEMLIATVKPGGIILTRDLNVNTPEVRAIADFTHDLYFIFTKLVPYTEVAEMRYTTKKELCATMATHGKLYAEGCCNPDYNPMNVYSVAYQM